MQDSHWSSLEQAARHAPPPLRSWLAEPGLLTARVRALCGEEMQFRQLGPLREVPLPVALQARLEVTDAHCLLREIEFCCGSERVVFAQTVLPASTLARFQWLRELGSTPLGEALREAGQPLLRDPLEYRSLPPDHPLALATDTRRSDLSSDTDATARLWARRAVYRLAGCPILVQEVFLPALLRIGAGVLPRN